MYRPGVLLPCLSCGKVRVLKLGDYCKPCALIDPLPASKYEYFILSPATINLAAERSGITREFLAAKMEHAFQEFKNYVVFKHGEAWKDVLISDTFHIPTIMRHLYARLEP